MADTDFRVKNGLVVNATALVVNSTTLSTTSNVTVTGATVNVGSVTVNTTSTAIGANVLLDTSHFFIGNSTVNVVVNSSSIFIMGGQVATISDAIAFSIALS